ncbi:MAG TPA: hypothetical protein ENJ53_04795 [Phaeodactylibacter sp.]|nr:hypothetical protein [Phaeodactylibacter sp.]
MLHGVLTVVPCKASLFKFLLEKKEHRSDTVCSKKQLSFDKECSFAPFKNWCRSYAPYQKLQIFYYKQFRSDAPFPQSKNFKLTFLVL